jgi:hypothetical protein
MAEESILLKVGIDENQIASSEKAIVDLRNEIDGLKEANKALADQGKKNSVEYVRNETAIKGLNNTVRENQRILQASDKIQKSNTGSIADMRANVSRLKQEYVNLSAEERNNEKTGVALQKALLAQTEELKRLEGQIGVTGRNVGNYTGSIVEAVDQTGLFAKAQQALAAVNKVVTATTGAAGAATSSFNKILITSGVGAFVVVLGSLVAYLTQSQEGMDKLARATSAVSTFVSVLVDALIGLGKQIFDNVIPAFEGLGDIIAGIITLDFDRVKRGIDGVAEAAGNIDGINILEVGAAAVQAGKEAARLEGELQNLVRAEKALSLERAQSRQQLEDLKKLGEDVTKSTSERAAAIAKAEALEQGLEQKSIDLQKQRISILKQQNDLSSSTDADVNRVIDAEIELANLQQESATKQIELQNKRNALNKEAADKNKAAAAQVTKDQDAADAEALKKAAELQKELNANYSEAIKTRAAETDLAIRGSINSVKQQFADGLIDLDTYQEQLDQVEALAIETRAAALQGQLVATQENAAIDAETRVAIETDLQAQLRALQDETVSRGVAAQQAQLSAAAKLAEEKKQLAIDTAAAEVAAQDAVLNAAKNIFGEQSAAGKIAASFQALLDTYRGANLALGTLPPPFGAIAAAATVATGLANVAKINSKPAPKFEEGGGIEIGGPSHAGGGSDVAIGGRTVANVEGGEGLFVMKKNAFQSIKALSNYNQLYGGRSWTRGSSNYLADGGAISRAGVPGIDRRALQETQQGFEQAVSALNLVVRVTDINRVNAEVNQVKAISDLS